MSAGVCEGRVAIVTGAGRGLGREYAVALGAAGARVVVNDLGVSGDGRGQDASPAEQVVEEIRAAGGMAVASFDDVTDYDGGRRMVELAVQTFGDLHAVVNNAGFTRDRMFVNCTPEEWDATISIHLRGHFCTSNWAAKHWRDQAKGGAPMDARIINTSSGAGLQGSVGQSAYAAAKAGIAALTLVQAAELARYGVTANALAPSARTRMTEAVFADMMRKPVTGFDVQDPANVAPIVAWLVSPLSRDVTGQVFEVSGGAIMLSEGWRDGPRVDRRQRWDAAEIGPHVDELLRRRSPAKPVYGAG